MGEIGECVTNHDGSKECVAEDEWGNKAMNWEAAEVGFCYVDVHDGCDICWVEGEWGPERETQSCPEDDEEPEDDCWLENGIWEYCGDDWGYMEPEEGTCRHQEDHDVEVCWLEACWDDGSEEWCYFTWSPQVEEGVCFDSWDGWQECADYADNDVMVWEWVEPDCHYSESVDEELYDAWMNELIESEVTWYDNYGDYNFVEDGKLYYCNGECDY